MAKSPAINWYFDNWAGGTIVMSRHLKGCYMDLLTAQYQVGHLSLDQIKMVLGTDFSAWQALKSKFTEDEDGYFFNERLASEVRKRKEFSEKQSLNGKRGGRPKSQTKASENPTLNPNESQTKALDEIAIESDTLKKEKGGVGEKGKNFFLIPEMLSVFKKFQPEYPEDEEKDFAALGEIVRFIEKQENIPKGRAIEKEASEKVLTSWRVLSEFIANESFFRSYSLSQVSKYIQSIVQKFKNDEQGNSKGRQPKVDVRSAIKKLDQMSD